MSKNGYRSMRNKNRYHKHKHHNISQREKEQKKKNKYNSIKKLVQERKYPKALGEIEDYLYEYHDDEYGINLYVTILIGLNKEEEAKKQVKRLIHMDSDNQYSAMYKIGNLEKKNGNIEKAESLYKKVIKESPYNEGLTKVSLAQIYKEDCKIEKAKEILLSVKDEHQGAALLELSNIALEESKTIDAFNYVSQIKETDSNIFNRRVLIQKGNIEAAFNNYDLAKEYYENSLSGPRDNVYRTSMLKLMELEMEFENYDKALNICDELLQKGEVINGEIYLAKGQIYTKMNEYEVARQYYEKSKTDANKEKKDGKIAFNMGMLDFKEGKFNDAASNLIKSSHNRRYRKPSIINLIYIHIRKKDFKNANYYYEKAIKESIFSKDKEEALKIKVILDKERNKHIKLEDSYSYSLGQYINYDEKEAYEHIEKNHYGEDFDRSVFNDDINLEELILDVKTKIVPEKRELQGLADCYYIEMDNVGKTREGEECNVIKVIVIPDTRNIITMYPISNRYGEERKKEKPKVKKMSRIEMFNKKYNLD